MYKLILLFLLTACHTSGQKTTKMNQLTAEEQHIILQKGTERPFTGIYNEHTEAGIYLCKQCDAPLYRSSDKFDGHCGWPSFDEEIPNAIKRIPDADGRRTEIVCANCGGHLGHVFLGEKYTKKNTRHCVNSLSLNFEPLQLKTTNYQTAYFAGGCFWGMEYYFQHAEGVVSTDVGYMGGHTDRPTYQQICSGTTGHYEALEVVYDNQLTDFEQLTRLFFEIHDPTQTNGQGPDIGEQYLSVAFYSGETEKATINILIQKLEKKGYKIATKVLPKSKFWQAEKYHQNYYDKTQKEPYCHAYTKRFD